MSIDSGGERGDGWLRTSVVSTRRARVIPTRRVLVSDGGLGG